MKWRNWYNFETFLRNTSGGERMSHIYQYSQAPLVSSWSSSYYEGKHSVILRLSNCCACKKSGIVSPRLLPFRIWRKIGMFTNAIQLCEIVLILTSICWSPISRYEWAVSGAQHLIPNLGVKMASINWVSITVLNCVANIFHRQRLISERASCSNVYIHYEVNHWIYLSSPCYCEFQFCNSFSQLDFNWVQLSS